MSARFGTRRYRFFGFALLVGSSCVDLGPTNVRSPSLPPEDASGSAADRPAGRQAPNTPDARLQEEEPSRDAQPPLDAAPSADAAGSASDDRALPPAPAAVKPNRLSGNFTHGCAVLSDGTVRCWGGNASGQLGNGAAVGDNNAMSFPPVQVAGIGPPATAPAVSVATARETTCVSLADGAVKCWGSNVRGQLGSGSTGARSVTPVAVVGLKEKALTVIAGEPHFCALLADRTVACWGSNDYGNLGVPKSTAHSPTPVAVAGLNGVVAIAGGWKNTCALREDESVWCWGDNAYGQLGDVPASGSSTPVRIPGLAAISMNGLGHGHLCVVATDGSVRCWGKNEESHLGNGPGPNAKAPVQVRGISDGAQIGVGAEDTCVLRSGGVVSCWGRMTGSGTPVEVKGIQGAVAIGYGKNQGCALLADDSVACFTGTMARVLIPPRRD